MERRCRVRFRFEVLVQGHEGPHEHPLRLDEVGRVRRHVPPGRGGAGGGGTRSEFGAERGEGGFDWFEDPGSGRERFGGVRLDLSL